VADSTFLYLSFTKPITPPMQSSDQAIQSKLIVPSAPFPPPGFTLVKTPGGHQYLVPDYMVPTLELELERVSARSTLQADQAAPGVSKFNLTITLWPPILIDLQPRPITEDSFIEVAEGNIIIPADPVSDMVGHTI
jgi:hypothetical protein